MSEIQELAKEGEQILLKLLNGELGHDQGAGKTAPTELDEQIQKMEERKNEAR